ncbi:MAG: ribosome biogenesis GTPase Der [Clostridia bacterium]
MGKKPFVAVIGRPNTGKSTFFNRIVGKRISIVEDEPNVTRDRVFADAEWCGKAFTMIDTGGIDEKKVDVIAKGILKQAEIALAMADVVLFFVDGKQGLVPEDYQVADKLRKSKKPIILVVNKLDNMEMDKTYDFYALGLGEPSAISATQARGLGDLLDRVVESFSTVVPDDEPDDSIKIAIVGRPNSGKSSIVNKLLGEERMIVSSVSGTTRDAIDIPLMYKKKKFTLIDTAGLRRKRSVEDDTVERFSTYRTIDSIDRADVVLIVIDAGQPLTEQDIKIAGLVHERNKPSVIVMNKWDTVSNKDTNTQNKLIDIFKIELAYMTYFKTIFISALTGQNIGKIMEAVEYVYANSSRRITTGVLNDIVQTAIATSVSSKNGKKLKVFYATQTGINPPTFVVFVNDEKLINDGYLRYIENSIRKSADFTGTPMKIVTKSRSEDKL